MNQQQMNSNQGPMISLEEVRERVAFIGEEEGPSDILPAFVSTTTISKLYGWKPGESLDDAIARTRAARAAKGQE